MKKQTKQSVDLFIPITALDAIWRGSFEKLPPKQTFELVIDYPFLIPIKFKINTGANGLTLVSLLGKIGKYFDKAYEVADKDEDQWYGHGIDDLNLYGVNVDLKKKQIRLDIGS